MQKKFAAAAVAGVLSIGTASAFAQLTQASPQAPASPAAAAPDAPVTWTSDPALASTLGSELKMYAFTLHLPGDFNEVAPTVDITELRKNGVDSHTYNRERLPDGTAPSFGITVATLPPQFVGKMSVVDALTHIVAQKKGSWKDFSQTKPERGLIGGVPFLRTYYKGVIVGPKGRVNVQGFSYAAVDDKYIIGIDAEDTAEHYATTRPAIEAAIMTLHR